MSVPEPSVKRSYSSPLREEKAAATRARIRTAAHDLFVGSGYAATSMREIAARAGVSERTVYATFPSKQALYGHVLGVALVGDEEPVAVADRPETHAALESEDPREVLRIAVEYGADLLDRAGDLIFVGIEAAGADPELRRTGDEGDAATYAYQRGLAQRLHALGALRAGMTVDAAADILYLLGSPHTHRLLRRQRGWSTRRYRAWVLDTAIAQLLAP